MRKPKNHAKPLGKPNGKIHTRQAKAPIGHSNRVAALKKKPERRAPAPAAVRSAPDRIRGRKPGFDGTPNMPADDAPLTTLADLAGPIQIDDQLAAAQLRELAEIHPDVPRAQARYNEKLEDAKTAKKTVESKNNYLLEKLRTFTHPPSLPLFDQATAQHERQQLLDADAAAREQGAFPLTGGEALTAGASKVEDEPAGVEA